MYQDRVFLSTSTLSLQHASRVDFAFEFFFPVDLLTNIGEDGSETLEYEFDVDKTAHRSVYTEFGLIGRGTTVIPVKSRKTRTEPSSSEEEPEELVAKVAWPHTVRMGEDVFITKVRTGLERSGKTQMLQHIVDMKAALTKDAKAMGLPRQAMGLCPGREDLRVCRILVLKRYRPLHAIESQAEFHKVFVQVVRGMSTPVCGLQTASDVQRSSLLGVHDVSRVASRHQRRKYPHLSPPREGRLVHRVVWSPD